MVSLSFSPPLPLPPPLSPTPPPPSPSATGRHARRTPSPIRWVNGKLGSLLHHCSKTGAFRCGLSLHAVLIKMGLESDVFLSNHLINMYAKCGNIMVAYQVFVGMTERNLVSWSAMMSGCDQGGKPLMALYLFSEMELQPNEYIYASTISACARLLALDVGKQVHAQSLKTGYMPISFVSNSLMSMYMKCGLFNDAFTVFRSTLEPNYVSYNAMITGFADNLQFEKSLELFKLMNQHGLHADQFSLVAMFGICTNRGDFQAGVSLHCQAVKLGLAGTAFVGNVILTMYAKCGSIREAEKVFQMIKEKDVVSCNTFIAACSHCGDHVKAMRVYRDMEKAFGIAPDDFTIASALAACAGLASIHHGGQIHARLIRNRSYLDVAVCNALINVYAKCGCIEYAESLFHRMSNRNLVSWNTIIAGFGNHGHGIRAVEMFEEMRAIGILPDSCTFIGLLIACNHAGMVDEGQAYFDSMEGNYNIAPGIEHLSCLIDLLGRAGRLEEAENYLKTSSFKDDSVIWGSLLSSCRLHGDVIVGERAAKKLLELRPKTSSPYVLLSNLYALDGRWDAVAEARKMLKGSAVKKEPGHSLIQVEDIVEKFTVGDISHVRIDEIRQTLISLNLTARKLYLET